MTHTKQMIERFLMLEKLDPEYAVWAIKEYRNMPNCPCPDIVRLVKEEKKRRQTMGEK